MAWVLLAFAVAVWMLTSSHDNSPIEDGRWQSWRAKDRLVLIISGIFGVCCLGMVLWSVIGLIAGF